MDIGSTGGLGHYLRVAAFPLKVFLHQAEVDIKGFMHLSIREFRVYNLQGQGLRKA